MKKLLLVLPIVAMICGGSIAYAKGPVHVHSYTKKDGTYVHAHTRALPGMGAHRSSSAGFSSGSSANFEPTSPDSFSVAGQASQVPSEPLPILPDSPESFDQSLSQSSQSPHQVPDTGGEPALVSLCGLVLVGAAFGLRHRFAI